ncbi:MAG: HepT-like ribonuclease domain-containing protein [Bacteroidota bacterium]
MPKEPIEYLKHIRDESSYLLSVITPEKTKDDFLADETLKRAVIRSLEIIGEATKKIPADFKVKWSTIKWKNMAGMRDRLIHDYMGVNYSIVWDVVKNKIPELYEQVIEVTGKE